MNQTIQQNNCLSLGGFQKIWIAVQSKGEAGILKTEDDFVEIILDRDKFQLLDLGRGQHQFTESLTEDAEGNAVSASINYELIRERTELLDFEKRFKGKLLMAVLLTNNNDERIFRNLTLTRTGTCGAGYSGKNGFTYNLTGNSIDVATFAKSQQAIFWFKTKKNGTLNTEIVFTGDASWLLADGRTFLGNSISATGLDGYEQTVTIDSETAALGISELYLRNQNISGEVRLDLLGGLKVADLALNEIETITVGDWANQQGVLIELRDNNISPEAQEALLIALSNKIAIDSSNLKIGLMNQSDGQGGHFLPNANAIALAKEIYERTGAEVWLSGFETLLDL
jgi:hypothetical protein